MSDVATHATSRKAAKPKLLLFVSEDWVFCSHRLPLARAAIEAGFHVSLLTNVSVHRELIESSGIEVIPLKLKRRSVNPLRELGTVWQVMSAYRSIRPDIVHHVAIKPVLYGSIAARLCGVPRVVNALTGLGYLFTSDSLRARLLRTAVTSAFKVLFKRGRSRIIVQNHDDMKLVTRGGMALTREVVLVRGAGVSVTNFSPSPEQPAPITVVLPARMLRDKGVFEFVEAARLLKANGCKARFVLVGDEDQENPANIPSGQLRLWQKEQVVEWWGRQEDMPTILSMTHIVCLPTYREGLPKALLEASASGRPIVATDVPGCREIVQHGVNGLLVPPRDVGALAAALLRLIESPEERTAMGLMGREIVISNFSDAKICDETLRVYGSLFE